MTLRRSLDQALHRILRNAPFARFSGADPDIGDLGVIGDRRTAAVITRTGEIVWYCPGRLDAPSLFGGLLDRAIGGTWRVDLSGAEPEGRRYVGESAVLETVLRAAGGSLIITDWMNLPRLGPPHGMLCRRFSAAPAPFRLLLSPRSDYGQRVSHLRCASPRRVVIDGRFQLHSSHPVSLHGGTVAVQVPRGEASWAVLSDSAAVGEIVTEDKIGEWHAATLAGWRQLAEGARYDGPYRAQVEASLRMLRLLVFEETGGTAAALTTSLPEVIGGIRNFDYRYSWLRDSSIVIRALTRFERDGTEARRYLGFVAGLVDTGYRAPLDPVAAVGGERVPPQSRLRLAGYRGSRPTWAGNKAARQFQLGSLASFLLAAKEVYEQLEPRLHWHATSAVADFLAANWQRRGNGVWEQKRRRQFTSSKAFTVCGLEAMARFADDPAQAERFRAAARAIRNYVEAHCRTRGGGYAAVAGADAVDISAALFPVFGDTAADDPTMDATVHELERRYCVGNALYHRHLESARAQRREGAFLAGTFWIAHYWVVRGDLERGRKIMEAGLGWANDLGVFPEEVDANSGTKLGNVPLGLVHASFLAAVEDYNAALTNDRRAAQLAKL